MPPQRTFPSMKPLKTERTHEENQERAYIAASRRSDRSLEARVESARRASEIHKRRTGRSLRVTEQDVINEEMYEEEDDDIPSQYRRLTAHLQTGSAEFNRRLQTYLANHVAMRTALNDAIHNNFSQHYPNAPQFAHNTSGAYTSPLITQGYPGTEAVRSPTSLSPSSSHAYRSAPYPMPGHAGFRGQTTQQQQQQIAARAFPLMPPQMQHSNPATPGAEIAAEARRMSMPNPKVERPDFKSLPEVATPLSDSAEPTDLRCGGDYFDQNAAIECVSEVGTPAEQVLVPSMQPAKVTNFPQPNLYSPFSMALPTESQQMINRAALPQNSFGAALMDGSENWMFEASGLGASNPGEMLKADSHFHPSTAGMNSTLLQDYPEGADVSLAAGGADMAALGSIQGLDFGQFIDLGGSNSSNVPSGAGTPVSEHQVWQDLVDSTWVEEPNAS